MFGLSNIGSTEIILVVVVLLIIFGPKKLPEFAKGLGEAIKQIVGSFKGETEETKKKE